MGEIIAAGILVLALIAVGCGIKQLVDTIKE